MFGGWQACLTQPHDSTPDCLMKTLNRLINKLLSVFEVASGLRSGIANNDVART
jgi:hypothetical protein